jgi:beta-mannanase
MTAPVQTASGTYSTATGSIDFTFPNQTTYGNTVVVIIGTSSHSVNANNTGYVQIGPSADLVNADNFSLDFYSPATSANVAVWVDTNCMGGANTVVAGLGSSYTDTFIAWAYELPGRWYADQPVMNNGNSAAWSSGATLPIPAVVTSGIALGFAYAYGASGTQTLTPSGAWANGTPLAVSGGCAAVSGWLDVIGGSSPNYTGTISTSNYWNSVAVVMAQEYTAQSAGIGVWRGEGGRQNPNGSFISGTPTPAQAIGNIEAYEAWINQPVDVILDYQYLAPTSWSNFENCWLGSNGPVSYGPSMWGSVLDERTLCLALSPCAGKSIGTGATTWAGEAAGTNDAHWTTLGNNLIAWGLGNSIIRLGREFNANWYNWCPPYTGDSATSYKNGWIHIVNLLRGLTNSHFTFMWNPCLGQGNLSSDLFTNWYPGNSYVDSIGFDCYDWGDYSTQTGGYTGARTLAEQQTNFSWLQGSADGFNALVAFVTTGAGAGKPVCFPEYGLVDWLSGGNYVAGGDDPYYIQSMEPYVGASQWSAMWEDKYVGLFEVDSVSGHLFTPDKSRQVFLNEYTTQPQIPVQAIPSLPTLPAGYVVQVSDMNALSNAASFLMSRPITRIHDGVGGQSVGTTKVPVTFSAADFDSTGMWNSTFPAQLTVITPGYYKVSYAIAQNSGVTMTSYIQVTTGSGNPQGAGYSTECCAGYAFGSGGHTTPHGSGIIPWYLYAGDIVQVYTFCNQSGAALIAGQGSGWLSSFLELEFVSI